MASSLAPGLLIATPQLVDDNFDKTVVFMIEHGSAGALGVVVNRPSSLRVRDLLSRLGLEYAGDPEAKVLVGGPLQRENILVLHSEGNEGDDSRALGESLFVGASATVLSRLYAKAGARVLCFAGYAGWGPGQVEEELERGAWIPAPLDENLIFAIDRQVLWDRALRGLGIDPRLLVPGSSDSDKS